MINLSKRALILLGVAYLAPLLVYVVTFGATLSSQHGRWAEFGSAMSGIYGPIIALSTLAVLIVQAGLQRQLNDHEFRQSHISQARQDIEFYATQLTLKLEQIAIPGKTFRTVLHANFQPATVAELDSENLRVLAANVDDGSLGIVSIWSGVYSVVAGLRAVSHPTFEMTLTSSLQKLVALLGFETCVALDNFHRARTGGKVGVPYQFSPLLEATDAV